MHPSSDMEERPPQRRQEDRDRTLNTKLDHLDEDQRSLVQSIADVSSSLALIKLEQVHQKELSNAHLRLLERAQELQLAKIEQLSRDIQAMASDVDKSPAGRQVKMTLEEHRKAIEEQAGTNAALTTWQNRVDGVLTVLQWVGAGGLIALAISIARFFK